ncbi:hypothetical protein D3C78_761670 [compost metagenome]
MTPRTSAPAPWPRISGIVPAIKAMEVITIGRKRRRHASSAASMIPFPWISSSRANSTIRIAFLQARPIRTTRPTCTNTLLSPPVSQTPNSAESIVIGTISITASGSVQLSYSAASTRNASSTATGKTISAVFPCVACWKLRSVH